MTAPHDDTPAPPVTDTTPPPARPGLGLIADIGGTNARFALVDDAGATLSPRTLLCADYDGPAEAAEAYLREIEAHQPVNRGAFCAACPVLGDRVKLTNNPWDFSVDAVRRRLKLDRLEVVNDFVANALAVPHLGADDRVRVGGGPAVERLPVAVLGPGTGLGVALLVPLGGGKVMPVATEGGHVTMPARTPREAEVLGVLRRRFDHVSAERVISGSGLVNVYQAVCGLDGATPDTDDPAELGRRAAADEDPRAREALDLMFAMLGTVAGNLALSSGALGGVAIMGGIVPRYLDLFQAGPFREAFEAKGRFRAYMRGIPVDVVTHAYPAFVGLAGLVRG
ncbi:Glucokinase [Caenispirillum salinarum AK4]|uniref:Glucokinase n=1 Tax=Caenispirillum salinarum AK4 TaxID=1238182 RepID=K9HJM1_9PROT|nr:glucokinase [Caenispirillum salinarum]EKV30553.1 Glucokinase [Caenispirillum salinarum AK4]